MNIAKKKDLEKSRLTNKVENIKMVIRFDENLKNVNPAQYLLKKLSLKTKN